MKNEEIIKKWYEEVWNKKRENAIDEMLSPTAIAHGLTDENNNEVVGAENFKVFFRKFIASFPDIQVNIENTVSEGNKIAALAVVRLTHAGSPFKVSAEKSIAPSGKAIQFSGITITVIKDGKIQEAWNHFDFLSLFMQMGMTLSN